MGLLGDGVMKISTSRVDLSFIYKQGFGEQTDPFVLSGEATTSVSSGGGSTKVPSGIKE